MMTPAKRRRALLESNPPRNSRRELIARPDGSLPSGLFANHAIDSLMPWKTQGRRAGAAAVPAPTPAAAVHADRDPVGAQHPSKAMVGELAALVGVKDLWLSLGQRLLQRLDAEAGLEQIGEAPRQHVAAHPVHHRNQVKKAVRHGDV